MPRASEIKLAAPRTGRLRLKSNQIRIRERVSFLCELLCSVASIVLGWSAALEFTMLTQLNLRRVESSLRPKSSRSAIYLQAFFRLDVKLRKAEFYLSEAA
jgi:hypothetical protein